jgi:hypothetical protein
MLPNRGLARVANHAEVMMNPTRNHNRGATASRRPAGQSDGSGKLSVRLRRIAADRGFPAAVQSFVVVGLRKEMSMPLAAVLLIALGLTGCVSLNRPVTHESIVGTWQCKSGGLLSSVHTLQFHKDGSFSYHSTDMIVGLEMVGAWQVEGSSVHIFPRQMTIRGKQEPVPAEWSKGFISQRLSRRGRNWFLQIDGGDEFERISEGGKQGDLRQHAGGG